MEKSPYFEHHSDDENEDGDEAEEGSKHESETESEFEHEPTTSLFKKRGDMIENEDTKPEKRRSSTNLNPSFRAKKPKRSGEIFIPIRQPSPGDTEYQSHMIHPNTLDFLKGL